MGNTHPNEQLEVIDVKSVVYGALMVQEERAAAYKEFENAFKRSCATLEDEAFRDAIARVTPVFQDLSKKMQKLEKVCNEELGRPDVAYILRQIQNKEREKLRLTTDIQALKRSGLMEQEDQIGQEDVSECSCHAVLPSGHDVRSAAAEGYQELEQCIIDINSLIEELYFLKMDM